MLNTVHVSTCRYVKPLHPCSAHSIFARITARPGRTVARNAATVAKMVSPTGKVDEVVATSSRRKPPKASRSRKQHSGSQDRNRSQIASTVPESGKLETSPSDSLGDAGRLSHHEDDAELRRHSERENSTLYYLSKVLTETPCAEKARRRAMGLLAKERSQRIADAKKLPRKQSLKNLKIRSTEPPVWSAVDKLEGENKGMISKEESEPKHLTERRTSSWGEDKLAPKATEVFKETFSQPSVASSASGAMIRRVEGEVPPSKEHILREISCSHDIPKLAHGLDRVLFNPGVHWLQDPRSRVFNFTPYLQQIPDVTDFAFERISPYVTSSKDTTMQGWQSRRRKRFAGSTSSLSGLLSHIYFLISEDRPVDISVLCKPFCFQSASFAPSARIPSAVVYKHREGKYSIDADKADDESSQWNILSWMGTMLEHFLTLRKDTFIKLLRSKSPAGLYEYKKDSFRFSETNSFVMRSQLDCRDQRLPGSGIFDIKTRAALPLRLDTLNYKMNSGYLIKSLHGALESFDREYYDLIRSAFLKYGFQARIGNMDGVFIAYHNTARIFGFQYVPLTELDERVFGVKNVGAVVFDKCVGLLEAISDEVVNCFPGQSVTCLAETLEGVGIMRLWVQPIGDYSAEDSIPEPSVDRPMPIVQLEVSVKSFIQGNAVPGTQAVARANREWNLQWSISCSSLDEDAIRQNLSGAKKRKLRNQILPMGVDKSNIDEFLYNLDFGNERAVNAGLSDSNLDAGGDNAPTPTTTTTTKRQIDGESVTSSFVSPPGNILVLRNLAREGHIQSRAQTARDRARGVQILQPAVIKDPEYHVPLEGPVYPEVQDILEHSKGSAATAGSGEGEKLLNKAEEGDEDVSPESEKDAVEWIKKDADRD